MKRILRRKDLIYPELSYQIIGILFEVYNRLGPGYHEKYYQRAIATALRECRIPFREQVYVSLIKIMRNKVGGDGIPPFPDFLNL